MPKQYINWPSKEDVKDLQISLGMSDKDADGIIGPKTLRIWKEELELPIMGDRPDSDDNAIMAPHPQIGLHWDGRNGTVQLSLNIDLDLVKRMIKAREENPTGNFGETNYFPNRITFYTGNLDRDDLQTLVKETRRARNAVYGADE
jgi:hypothetical protein